MSPALSLENVTVRYGERAVLGDISLAFEAGTLTGLVGPNGAGKTTLLRTCLGLLPAQAGTVRVFGRPLGGYSPDARARAIAYLPQSTEAHWPLVARRVVALGRLPHRPAFARILSADEAAIDKALARCDATALAGRRLNEISAGERARVLLARALATVAPILLVDEPAAHLDPAHQLRLMELLREEARRGTAVVVTLHDLPLAARYCDRLVLLKNGGIAAAGPPQDALSDAALAHVFGVGALRVPDATGKMQLVVTPM
ncbi:MAG: ABC transporter ATP-binding protein [Alphaproteobacteria bacterium]|nr:ABC transporter ATP-binding protein [Alphaproteobacteria bacterium]MBU6474034.1 ABC transporter ATP-binding protein [Alphaproteobacteria bacterium]MDE2014274.1 ABC transporter ATP-binding protein [Alphaproteobacteria bacterium]MDE2072605.1 ABC transporter ATP-binding protein [Alphaproteobacteria bacterium]MDE2352290.1 ABC transporter ATP-binding protein [Alphaproteobacteria bacterium]